MTDELKKFLTDAAPWSSQIEDKLDYRFSEYGTLWIKEVDSDKFITLDLSELLKQAPLELIIQAAKEAFGGE